MRCANKSLNKNKQKPLDSSGFSMFFNRVILDITTVIFVLRFFQNECFRKCRNRSPFSHTFRLIIVSLDFVAFVC